MKILEKQQISLANKLDYLEKQFELLKLSKKNEGRSFDTDMGGFYDPSTIDMSYQLQDMQTKIKELELVLNNIEVVKACSDNITIGSIFDLTFVEDNETLKYALSDSSVMIDGLEIITTNSEMGKLLLGHKSDDIIAFRGNTIKIGKLFIEEEKQKKIEK